MGQTQEHRVQYTISATDDGLPGVKSLVEGLSEAAVESAGLKEEAVKVAAELRNVGLQQAAVDTLRDLGSEGRALSAQLNQATEELERLARAKGEAAARAKTLADAERQAGADVDAARADMQGMQQTLKDLQAGNEAAARGTDEYKASVAQAKSTIAELRVQLQEKQTTLAQAQAATKTAASEERALGNEYGAAMSAARKASEAVGEHRKAMEGARDAARSLGVDTGNLAGENDRLKVAAQDARKGLDALAVGAEKVRQRQADADAVLKEFQADLRKLTTEGPQAPAGLEEAFKRLGLNGVKRAETAIHELQVALAQVRNSPDVLGKDKEAAVAAFNKRLAELKAEANGAAASTDRLTRSTDGARTAIASAAHKAVAWTTALVGLNQLKDLVGDVIATGAAFENLETRLGNLLGGTEAAGEAMGMIKDLASTTPFAVSDMAESFIKLTAFGLQPTEQQMRSLADVAANLGGGTEVLTGVTLALGQAWTKGKLQGEEILQLAERGVPVWDALAAATGRSVPELQKMSAAGELGRDVISKLIDELGRMNEGASDELMRTFAGAVSNAKDAIEEFFTLIADSGALDWLTEKIRDLLAEFDRMKETGELKEAAQGIADGFVVVAETAEVVVRTLIEMAPAIEMAVTAWLGFKAINIATTLYAAATAMTTMAAGAGSAAAGMSTAAVAATALGVAIKRLLAATGVGLLLVAIGEVGVRLLGVGEEAKKAGDDVEDGLGRAEEASRKAGDAAKAAAVEQARLVKEVATAAEARAKAVKDAAENEVKAVEAVAATRNADAAVALQELETKRLLADQSVEMAKALGDEKVAIQARVTQMEIDIEISEAKIRTLRTEAENTVAVAKAKLAEVRVSSDVDAAKEAELEGSIRLAEGRLKEADAMERGIDVQRERLEQAKRASQLDKEAAEASRALTIARQGEAQVAIASLQTDKELARQAEEMARLMGDEIGVRDAKIQQLQIEIKIINAKADASRIEAEGSVAVAQARLAELKASNELTPVKEAEINAAIKLGQAKIKEAEAMRASAGLVEKQIDLLRDGANAADDFASSLEGAGKRGRRAMGDLRQSISEVISSAEQLNDLMREDGLRGEDYLRERNKRVGSKEAAAEERKRTGVDRDGFSVDDRGNRITMGGDLTSLTGIANFLKQAGLDAQQAKQLALEFSDGKGGIPYLNNPGQMRYGGATSTMSEALLKAAERITFGVGSAGASSVGGNNSQSTGPGKNYNIKLDGGKGRRAGFRFSTQEDADEALKAIEVAAGRS
jgi:tape measure domain-containing protein